MTQEREVNLSVVEKIFLLHGRSVLWVDSVCFGMTSLILWGGLSERWVYVFWGAYMG